MIISKRTAACGIVLAFLIPACSDGRVPTSEQITVAGTVTVRGNEPFSAYVLETEDRNSYVLQFSDAFPQSTPAELRVTGRLFQDDWNGRPYAHIEVDEFEPVR